MPARHGQSPRLQEDAAGLRACLGRPALHPASAVTAKRTDLSAARLAAARVTMEGLHEDRREREARLRSRLDLCDRLARLVAPAL